MWDPYTLFEKVTLENGLDIYHAHWPGRQWLSCGFLIHTGARNDPVGQEGLAHFVEHLISANGPASTNAIKNHFKNVGGSINLGITGYPYTNYACFIPITPSVVNSSFQLMADMLLGARLENHIERERSIIIREFKQSFPNQFSRESEETRKAAMYSDSWYGRFLRALGQPETVAEITQTALQRHYETHYIPQNMSIVTVGGLTLSEVITQLKTSGFSVSMKGVRTPPPTMETVLVTPTINRRLIDVSKLVSGGMSMQKIGYFSFARIPNTLTEAAYTFFNTLLSEVLFDEIREKRQWTYSQSNSIMDVCEFREFSLSIGSLPVNAREEIEAVVEVCLQKVFKGKKHFNKIKQQKIAQLKLTDVTGTTVMRNVMNDVAINQSFSTLAEDIQEYEKITFDDIQTIVSWLAPEQRYTLLLHP